MNKELVIEALSALVEKKNQEISSLEKAVEIKGEIFTHLLDYIYKTGGGESIDDAAKGLSAEGKDYLDRYIEESGRY